MKMWMAAVIVVAIMTGIAIIALVWWLIKDSGPGFFGF